MINAILINPEKNTFDHLERNLSIHCPDIRIDGEINNIKKIQSFLEGSNPKLLFVDLNIPDVKMLYFLGQLALKKLEFVVVSRVKEMAYEAFKYNAAGFILKPINTEELIRAIHNAGIRIQLKEEKEKGKRITEGLHHRLLENDLVGIPTMEGFDFVKINEIIRYEGMQRCTQVITTHKTNIISSYNLGEFRRLMEPYGFFSPHRSHLVNLNYISKYRREGSIVMQDGSLIPIARRKKTEFLDLILHV